MRKPGVVSVSFGFGPDAPQSRAEFLAYFLIGAGYLSAFIMGATGFAIMTAGGALTRLVAALYAIVTIGLPVGLLILAEPDLRAFAAARPGAFALIVVAYLLATSTAGMALLLHGGIGPTKGDGKGMAGPKGRLPG